MRRISSPAVAITMLLAGSGPAPALENENLLAPLPAGFKIGHQTRKGQAIMSEFIPAAETVENWSRMVTVQIFLGRADLEPGAFASRLAEAWKTACPGGKAKQQTQGVDGAYPTSLWLYVCPRLAATGKPETMWLKAIRGRDSFYAVQYAARGGDGPELAADAISYLRSVKACDTRWRDAACPKGMN